MPYPDYPQTGRLQQANTSISSLIDSLSSHLGTLDELICRAEGLGDRIRGPRPREAGKEPGPSAPTNIVGNFHDRLALLNGLNNRLREAIEAIAEAL